ncbi:MAG: hypothetical protein WCK21_03895 [Actinomycetota bacterium]
MIGNPAFRLLVALGTLISTFWAFAVVMVTITVQLGLGFSPFETILATGGLPAAVIMGANLSSRLVPRLGRNTPLVAMVLVLLGHVFIVATLYLAAEPFPGLDPDPADVRVWARPGNRVACLGNCGPGLGAARRCRVRVRHLPDLPRAGQVSAVAI